MKRIYTIIGLYLFLVAVSPSSVNAQMDGLDTFHLADPTIFPFGKKYYLYGTGDQGPVGFKVYISEDLKNWKLSDKNDGYALRKGESFGDKGFWAPQVFTYRKKFYMAYAANEQIAIAESDDPAGPFKQKVLQPLAADVKQIDPFVYFENGKVYLYHVRLTKGNRIFVAEMNEDLTAIKENTLKECISSILPWENTANSNWPVCEGPSVLKRDGLYYLFYSSNDFRNPDYAVGYATSETPTGPWKKFEGNPVIDRSLVGINGPGHGDFFTDQTGKLNYVLHTHNSARKVGPRNTAIIQMEISKGKVSVDKNSFHFIGIRRP
ncbi:MAG: glycoside hydrolase family 43 protein [Chitinophagaceae bacterium]